MVKMYAIIIDDKGEGLRILEQIKWIKRDAKTEIDHLMKLRRAERELTEASLSASEVNKSQEMGKGVN